MYVCMYIIVEYLGTVLAIYICTYIVRIILKTQKMWQAWRRRVGEKSGGGGGWG